MARLNRSPANADATTGVNVNPAETWPAWTDEDRWEPGPAEAGDFEPPAYEDERWWAEQNETWDDIEPDDEPDWDAMAADREADDRVCSGYYAW